MATPVTLRGLTKHFGKTVAVDNVSLDIPRGCLFFLLGPSGCGKTTLLRMLAGFIDPTAGLISFGPRDVTHLPANKRNTGMCFQSYALWPHMTVAQNVAFGLTVRKIASAEKTQRVNEALELVQMTAYAQRRPNELSGGQQQRVALARALVIRPDVLLLDEPLSNLDAKLRLDMRTQIRRICKAADITTVYVTHDQKEALSMADAMAVLRDGRLVQLGSPRELYNRPNSRFVADFLGETNFIPARVESRQGDELRLHTAAGPLVSRQADGNFAVGQTVTCSVRPESLRLQRSGQTADNHADNVLTARLIDSTYLGETAQHLLEVQGASSEAGAPTTIKVFELNPRERLMPMNDAAQTDHPMMRVCFNADDVVVLKDDQGASA